MLSTLRSLRFAPLLLLFACGSPTEGPEPDSLGVDKAKLDARVRPSIYVPVELTADLSTLSEEDRQMLPLLIGRRSSWTRCSGMRPGAHRTAFP